MMRFAFSASHLVVIFAVVAAANAWSVIIFSDVGFKGDTIALTGTDDECVDIPAYFSETKAVTTQEFCLRVFTEKNCNGQTMALFPGSPYHGELTVYKEFRIRSFRSCRSAF